MSKRVPTTTYISDKAPNLETLQKMVGGYIQMVESKTGEQIIIDEEGKLKPLNMEATKLWFGDSPLYDVLVGDAVVLSGKARLK